MRTLIAYLASCFCYLLGMVVCTIRRMFRWTICLVSFMAMFLVVWWFLANPVFAKYLSGDKGGQIAIVCSAALGFILFVFAMANFGRACYTAMERLLPGQPAAQRRLTADERAEQRLNAHLLREARRRAGLPV